MSVKLDPSDAKTFNQLAREQMKLRLLADLKMDLTVCQIEGWQPTYAHELHEMIQDLCPCNRKEQPK